MEEGKHKEAGKGHEKQGDKKKSQNEENRHRMAAPPTPASVPLRRLEGKSTTTPRLRGLDGASARRRQGKNNKGKSGIFKLLGKGPTSFSSPIRPYMRGNS
ncbi:hypothetical protein PIB30_011078 [Stylosanthes scabra]|uniref:Uncharacterized protein n=1 Tax=Stylosanthes scabra TaxID=79078 RepID=A0ABU6X5C5_9FABA|nr:hypothetical protein [Stylosanthes scabra]